MEILNNKKNVIAGGIIVIVILIAIAIGGVFILNNSNKSDNINTNEMLNIEATINEREEQSEQSKIYVHIVGEVIHQRNN